MFDHFTSDSEPPDTYQWSYRNLRKTMFSRSSNMAVAQTGFSDKFEFLVNKKRFRSAMDELLSFLELFPANPDALLLALNSFFGERRNQFEAVEPLTPVQLADPRLDWLFSTCTQCEKVFVQQDELAWHLISENMWNGLGAMMSGQTMPDGVQCCSCGAVFCKDCMPIVITGPDLGGISPECPICKETALNKLILPNGRLPQGMRRTTNHISTVFMFREGPLPPDQMYMEQVLKIASPQAIDQEATLVGVATSNERFMQPIVNMRILQAVVNDLLTRHGLVVVETQSLALHGPGGLSIVLVQIETSDSDEARKIRECASQLFPQTEQIAGYSSLTELGLQASQLFLEFLKNRDGFNLYEFQEILSSLDTLAAESFANPPKVANPQTERQLLLWLNQFAQKLNAVLRALQLEMDNQGDPFSWGDGALELRRICKEYSNVKILVAMKAMYGASTRLKFEAILDRLWLIALTFSYPGKIER